MKNSILFFIVSVLFAFTFSGCKDSKLKVANPPSFNPEYDKYISAYTSGVVQRNSTIRIRFTRPMVKSNMEGKEVGKPLIKFDPSFESKVTWLDQSTIEVTPVEFLSAGQVYDGKLDLAFLFDTIPSEIKDFPFQFQTLPQTMEVKVQGLKSIDDNNIKWQRLEGEVNTSQYEYGDLVEKVLKANAESKDLKIRWSHFEDGKKHVFVVDSIQRKKDAYELLIEWNGKEIGVKIDSIQKIEVPAVDDFKMMNAESFNEPEQFIILHFSDPITPTQDLNGLIRTSVSEFDFIIEGSTVKAIPKNKLRGKVKIFIEPGITNVLGYKLKKKAEVELTFEDVRPMVRSVGNGTIIPKGDGIPFPFEAVNLSAVDVQITKIYEKNILEFLQFNELDGSSSLQYVGKVVLEKKIELNTDPDMNLGKWNRHALDLSELIQTEPGAIYRVNIRFRKDYSLYECDKDTVKREFSDDVLIRGEDKLWNYYNSYYSRNDDSYNNPCSDYYYINQVGGIAHNVLASDLGMLAKKGTDGSLMVVVTDIKTTLPLPGIPVEIYDFQQQIIKAAVTNSEGFAQFKVNQSPFVAVAKKGEQKGYLKLYSGALSLSKFDVSGNYYHKGIKGFIYGDRGVWRPGDSIYVSFILEDRQKVFPKDHPVVFEMYDPRGQLVKKISGKNNMNGFFIFPTVTGLNAPTGDYNVKINVGGVVFEKNLKVESIIPNRLKLNLEFANKNIFKQDKSIGVLKVSWLHGAPAKGLNADVTASMSRRETEFDAYPGFTFDDPISQYNTENKVVFDGELDDDGNATIPNAIEVTKGVPGALSVDFLCKVFEPGGNFSTDQYSSTYYPYNQYVGLKLPKGDGDVGVLFTKDKHNIEIATVDKDGKPVNGEVTVSLYKLEWRWWWDYYEDVSSYNGRFYNDPVASTIINCVNGKGKWQISVPEKEYGRYIVRAAFKDGHAAGKVVYLDNPGWYSRRPENKAGATMLTFSSDKDKYNVGDKATLEIPTGFSGRALVTIENGSSVIKADWVNATQGKTFYSFDITGEMAPNVYASVTLLQPHSQTANDLPVRLYGVIPIYVDDPESHIQPVIAMPEVLKPEETVNVSVQEKNGKPMTYTLAIVDDGLLDLTKFKTPDPWKYFYTKQSLQVSTWDVFDDVLGNYTNGLKKLLSVGGDGGEEEATPGQGTKVQRFKPMVRFIGPFTIGPNQSGSHTISIPQYIGSVRTMVIAGYEGAYGFAEKTTPVRKPLMVFGTLPRVLGPNEEVLLPVSIFAMEDNIKNVTVDVSVNNIMVLTGGVSKQVAFKNKGEQTVNFPIKVKPELGVAHVKIKARCGNETASFDIDLEVRPPSAAVATAFSNLVSSNASKILSYEAIGIKGSNKGKIEFSSMPPLNLEKHFYYLIQYPHGCIEQTTSSVFPQLYLSKFMTLSPQLESEISFNIKSGIERLSHFQVFSSGGMSYWPGEYEANTWGTNYAGHFLIEAQKLGYNLPPGMLDKWKKFQKNKANSWAAGDQNSDLEQAYRLYLLALAKSPELGAMNRLRENSGLSVTARWQLAAAYSLAGQKQLALSLTKDLSSDVKVYREFGNTYGSSFRDKAMILDVLGLTEQFERGVPLMMEIAKVLNKNEWLSTQETAFSLLAMGKFIEKAGSSKNMDLQYRVNNGPWVSFKSTVPVSQVMLDLEKQPKGKVEVKNNSSGPVYTNIILHGIPLVEQPEEDLKVTMDVEYKNMQGETIDPAILEQGTDFVAEIKISNGNDYDRIDEMALSAIFPSGWQIYNPRMTGQQFGAKSSSAEYMDIRDDRVYFYFDLGYQYYNRYDDESYDEYGNVIIDEDRDDSNGTTKIFRVALNASYIGKFYLPAVYTEAMYDHEVRAKQPGKWIQVVPVNKKPL
jgi:uncharacterized protein YfaS (alpha-2-macroglobulin family)